MTPLDLIVAGGLLVLLAVVRRYKRPRATIGGPIRKCPLCGATSAGDRRAGMRYETCHRHKKENGAQT